VDKVRDVSVYPLIDLVENDAVDKERETGQIYTNQAKKRKWVCKLKNTTTQENLESEAVLLALRTLSMELIRRSKILIKYNLYNLETSELIFINTTLLIEFYSFF
jgi:hypothetical protein